ncbi:glycosyltransferase family 1 protein [Clostridium botulinum]|uniref:glycosyltransferase family 1 protein n=1 Tax=Clostridium botulinum TaxID=1491 RepID=UPI003DA3B81D
MNEFNEAYNLAVGYEEKKQIFNSLIEYRKALFYCEDEILEKSIEDKIYKLEYRNNDLETIEKIKQYNMEIEKFVVDQFMHPNLDLKVENYVTTKKPKVKENLKVLFGTMEIANQMTTYSKALRKQGVESFTLNYYPNWINYNSSDFKLYGDNNTIIKHLSKLISQFDVFHFFFGSTLWANLIDIKILKKINKKVFMNYWGSEIRQYSKAVKINKYIKVKTKNEKHIREKIDLCAKYIDNCIVADKELYRYIDGCYKNVYFIPQAIDISEYKPMLNDYENKQFFIVHAPTNAECKGTKYIIEAIDKLKKKYNFDFKLVEKLPHMEAKKIYREADLIVDQILGGSYGLFSIECMCMGKPVVCYISDYMKNNYPEDIPLISANPNNIEQKLEYILNNKHILYDISKKGIEYTKKYHDMNKIAKQLIHIYK